MVFMLFLVLYYKNTLKKMFGEIEMIYLKKVIAFLAFNIYWDFYNRFIFLPLQMLVQLQNYQV